MYTCAGSASQRTARNVYPQVPQRGESYAHTSLDFHVGGEGNRRGGGSGALCLAGGHRDSCRALSGEREARRHHLLLRRPRFCPHGEHGSSPRTGKSVVNTKLAHDTPAYKALVDKHSYTGDATIFGRDYHVNYAPLTGEDGKVTGALFVGMPK